MSKENQKKNNLHSEQGSTVSRWWKKGVLAAVIAGSFSLGMYAQLLVHDNACHEKYTYINKEASCGEKVIDKRGYIELKKRLEDYFESEIKTGRLIHVAVYFRDLNAGPAFGIEEDETFSSASLLKLPVIISLLKMAEENPSILDQRVEDDAVLPTLDQFFAPNESLEIGRVYTIRELIEHALIYSDNVANEMVKDFLHAQTGDDRIVLSTLKDLGLIVPQSYEDEDITVRAYASLFRLLYNSSYLNPEYSDLLLSILSRSEFTSGLRGGVPESVPVAHKFGERYFDDIKQLHDCGIVYYPNNPYLLCVMTQGKDFQELTGIIGTISKMFYNEVESRRLD